MLAADFLLASPAKLPAVNAPKHEINYKEIGTLALKQLSGDWTCVLSRCSINFSQGRPNYLGSSDFGKKRIDVWIRPEHSVKEVAMVIAHELAHMLDYFYLTQRQREEWYSIRHINPEIP